MTDSDTLDGIARERRLVTGEMLVLTLLQQAMLGRDVIAERTPVAQQRKARVRDRFAHAAVDGHWSRHADLPDWARPTGMALAARVPAQQRALAEAAVPAFARSIDRRSRHSSSSSSTHSSLAHRRPLGDPGPS